MTTKKPAAEKPVKKTSVKKAPKKAASGTFPVVGMIVQLDDMPTPSTVVGVDQETDAVSFDNMTPQSLAGWPDAVESGRIKVVSMPEPVAGPLPPGVRTPEQDRAALRSKVRMFYDLQRLRLQSGGRMNAKAAGKIIHLHDYDVQVLARRSEDLHAAEKGALHDVEDHLKSIPFYRDVLSDKTRYKGIGPTMAGVILAEFDIVREDTASKMWAYAGLAPKPALRCRHCHTVCVEDNDFEEPNVIYKHTAVLRRGKPGDKDKDAVVKCKVEHPTREDVYESGQTAKPVRGEKLGYNDFLRTKLVGVLAPVMLQCNSPWRKQYDDYKKRKQDAGWGRNDGHRHQAAMRYLIKMLLLDIWKEWRSYLKLPVRPSYHEEKQGGHPSGKPFFASPRAPEPVDPEVAEELAQL